MLEQKRQIYRFDNFRLDVPNRELLRDGSPVALPAKAFDMLVVLVENGGRLVEKEDLFSRVWPDQIVEESNLTVQISAIRKALGERRENPRYLATVAGHGYRFTGSLISLDEEEEEVAIERHSVSSLVIESSQEQAGPDENALIKNFAAQRVGVLTARDEAEAARLPRAVGWRTLLFLCLAVIGISLGAFLVVRRTSSPGKTASEVPIRSIAVLPFKPLVPGSRDESLELGMADTLITRLDGIRTVLVRPTSSVRKYGGLEQDPVAAGRELNADAVLDGSIQRAGDRIRVTVRLIRVADGATLWSEQFDDRYVDIFAVQDSISSKVVGTLALKLGGDESRLLNKRYTENTTAFEAYLKGRHHWNKETKESLEKGIEYFREAIRLDPQYALAYAGIADSYNMMGYWGTLAPKEAFPQAKEAAQKSLEIDPTLAEAHCALAYAKFEYDWDVADAEREYQRAISLNPGYASAHQWYGEYLGVAGRLEEAQIELKRAREIDPLSQPINMITAAMLYMARRYDEAIERLQKTVELDPNFVVAYDLLAACYLRKGMYDQAVTAYEREYILAGENAQTVAALREAYQTAGMDAYWRKHIELLKERSKRTYVSPIWIAIDYSNLRDKERAFDWLEKAYEERSGWLLELKIDPTWDLLRGDSRFQELVERVRNSRLADGGGGAEIRAVILNTRLQVDARRSHG